MLFHYHAQLGFATSFWLKPVSQYCRISPHTHKKRFFPWEVNIRLAIIGHLIHSTCTYIIYRDVFFMGGHHYIGHYLPPHSQGASIHLHLLYFQNITSLTKIVLPYWRCTVVKMAPPNNTLWSMEVLTNFFRMWGER